MMIFHSYVSLPESKPSIFLLVFLWFSHFPMGSPPCGAPEARNKPRAAKGGETNGRPMGQPRRGKTWKNGTSPGAQGMNSITPNTI